MSRFNYFLCIMANCIAFNLAISKPVKVPKSNIVPKHPTKPRLYILAIGVNSFDDEFWPKLSFPERDVQSVIDNISQNSLYNVIPVSITGKKATKSNILKKIAVLNDQVNPKDAIFVYISTHGTLDMGDSGDFEKVTVVFDTKKEKLSSTGLNHRDLLQRISQLNAKKKFVIMATCHSGVGKSRLSEDIQRLLATTKGEIQPLEDVSEGLIVLAASSKGETARESHKLGGDIYTHFFLEGLSTYDRNKDGAFSALEAHDYAKQKTYAYTKAKQRPTALIQMIGDADLLLKGKRKRKGLPILEAYDNELTDIEVEVDGQPKGVLPFAFPLKPGTSKVSLYKKREKTPYASYLVKAKMGETIDIKELTNPPPWRLGLTIDTARFLNKKVEALIGSPQLTFTGLEGHYTIGNLILGLGYFTSNESSHDLQTSLNAKSHWRYTQGKIGYQVTTLSRLALAGHLILSRDTYDLKLNDPNFGDSLEFPSQSTGIAIAAGFVYPIFTNFTLEASLKLKSINFDFDSLGRMRGDSYNLLLQIYYAIGGKVRPI